MEVKQKTAMMVLKKKLQVVDAEIDEDFSDGTPNQYNQGYKEAMLSVVKDIDAQMLELERKQIELAYKDGGKSFSDFDYKTTVIEREASDYFTTTYPPHK